VIRQVGPVRVALIGLTTTDTPVNTHPRTSWIDFSVGRGRRQGNDRSSAISSRCRCSSVHLDRGGRKARERGPGHRLSSVGGHTHTRIEEPVRVDNTLLVRLFEKGRVSGPARSQDRGRTNRWPRLPPHPITPESGSDEAVAAMVARYRSGLDQKLGEPVEAPPSSSSETSSRSAPARRIWRSGRRHHASGDRRGDRHHERRRYSQRHTRRRGDRRRIYNALPSTTTSCRFLCPARTYGRRSKSASAASKSATAASPGFGTGVFV